jgi:hypothetical protein
MRWMFRRLAGRCLIWCLVLGLIACCHRDDVKPGAPEVTGPTKPSFTIFALAEVRGQIGPCGCTSDPLGDIARTTQLIADAEKAGPVFVVDAGSLLYSQNPVPAHLIAQEELKADLLANIYKKELRVTAVGLGPADTAMGPGKERLKRIEANVTGDYATQKGIVAATLGAKIGVFGVIAEDAFKVPISDPIAAGKQAVKDLRGQGAQVVVALVQASTKKDAVTLAKAIGGIDLAIAGLGQNAPEPDAIDIEPTKLDNGWLVIPGNRGQIVSRIDVYERAGATTPLADAIGAAAAKAKIARLDKDLAARDAELARFAADNTADQAFVAAKQKERADVVAQRAQLENQPLVVPAAGSYFTLDQVKISKGLACSVTAQNEVTAFYAAAGAANVKAAEGKAPEPAAKGKPSYVGSESCGDCHDAASKYWTKTVHAQAWKTLVDRGQQFDYDCIGCHVTGWQQPGGSNLAHNDTLRDVQCETCHGPASVHVAKGGQEKPLAIVLDPPENLCASQCHTHEHSDTFQHDAYLRDIVGPGHGEKRRAKLGDGPTGASLRKAALDKAGKSLGANCTR